MKNKKILLILAAALSLSFTMTACNFGGDEEDQVVATPTPEPTEAPEPTPTIAPDVQDTRYTTPDKAMSIELPDATWADTNETESGVYNFESPEQGRIRVLYGKGEEAMSTFVVPTTQDTVAALEAGSGMTEGTDFEITHFKTAENNGVGAYEYIVRYLNTEKSGGYSYVARRVYANDSEYCDITAYVKPDDTAVLKSAARAVKSFRIHANSTLKDFAKKSDSTASGTGSSGLSEEAMSDTNQSRTIYRNSDGSPLVVKNDGNGNWTDDAGNSYNFANDTDVYDQDGTDYYYHGEAADVYYMPVSE